MLPSLPSPLYPFYFPIFLPSFLPLFLFLPPFIPFSSFLFLPTFIPFSSFLHSFILIFLPSFSAFHSFLHSALPSFLPSLHPIAYILRLSQSLALTPPARIAQWLQRSTWKLQVVGSIPGLVNLTIINCLSDETLNLGHEWQCYTPSTLKNQAELSAVSSCTLALSPVTTNRFLGVSLRWATGSDDK